MNRDLAILSGAGVAWSQRLKKLAARAPSLDIFTEGFVLRDDAGWQLTTLGRAALRRIELPAPQKPTAPKLALIAQSTPASPKRASFTLRVVGGNERRRVATERSA
ncbi:MAG: hypothetical protein JWQ24_1569 [Tardiphaga sp.]|nr:hypothetical protein [Tardiphaga sp.]